MGVLLRPPSSHDQPVKFPPLPHRRRVSFWNHLSRSITTHWHTVECRAEVHSYPAKTCQGRYRSDATEQLQVSAGCWSGPRRTRVTLQALMSSTPNIVPPIRRRLEYSHTQGTMRTSGTSPNAVGLSSGELVASPALGSDTGRSREGMNDAIRYPTPKSAMSAIQSS